MASQSSSSTSVIKSEEDEWDQWRRSYVASLSQSSENDTTTEPPATQQQEDQKQNDSLEVARQYIIRQSKTGALNDNNRLGSLLNRLLREQQEEIMDRSISKPWTIVRPGEHTSQPQLLRQIEWHTLLLLELWIHHGERMIQQVYPQLLVLQYSRQEAQKKEDKEKRKWKKRNKPNKPNKHVKNKTSKPFSTTSHVLKKMAKWQSVMERNPSLVAKLQTATPQHQEYQLLQHLTETLSQAAFFLRVDQSMTQYLNQKCLSLRIWKALPQVVTHVYDALERSNPYLSDTKEDSFSVNILTTTKKKKPAKKKSKSKPPPPPPSRPKLVVPKRNRLGHFHHRSRAAQSTMSKVLEHLSPVKSYKTPGKSGRFRSSSLVTPAPYSGKSKVHKTPKLSLTTQTPSMARMVPRKKEPATNQKDLMATPKLSLRDTNTTTSLLPRKKAAAAQKNPMTTPTLSLRNEERTTPSVRLLPRKKPPAVTTNQNKHGGSKIQPPLESSSQPQQTNTIVPRQKIAANQQATETRCENKAARRNATTTTMPSPTKAKLQRSKGLFPLSPIPNTTSRKMTTTTPTRKRSYEMTNPASWKTPQRYEARVAETPDIFPPPPKRVMSTPVRRRQETIVAETPDHTTMWKQQPSSNGGVQEESPSMMVAETPLKGVVHTTVAETPEEASQANKEDWTEMTPEPVHWAQDEEDSMAPMELFAEQNKKKPRVYSLGAGKLLSSSDKTNVEEEMVKERRHATQAVLTQARAFRRRQSLMEDEEEE